tara:strand:- start:1356 stop:1466 length:111 start_codon:yes stop_codon:yes gene_type:complete
MSFQSIILLNASIPKSKSDKKEEEKKPKTMDFNSLI